MTLPLWGQAACFEVISSWHERFTSSFRHRAGALVPRLSESEAKARWKQPLALGKRRRQPGQYPMFRILVAALEREAFQYQAGSLWASSTAFLTCAAADRTRALLGTSILEFEIRVISFRRGGGAYFHQSLRPRILDCHPHLRTTSCNRTKQGRADYLHRRTG